ncbi:low temperature requirement protein A [Janibacter corallicola]|uniref:low temperature requirement protein A n=1 Tax=Janibacter corallicola TaxID=415212 RepID=UPI0024809AB7|nr:low temperature requirement protein A [Janibacter corallicola]
MSPLRSVARPSWPSRCGGHVLAKNYTNLLAWSATAGVLFLVGAFLEPGPRLIVWIAALFVDVAVPRFQFRFPGLGSAPMSTWPTDPEHLAERNRGVFIIALGESILITGLTLSELDPIPARAAVAALLGFAGLFVLWWAYFALAGPDTQASQGQATPGRCGPHSPTPTRSWSPARSSWLSPWNCASPTPRPTPLWC